MSQHCGAMKDGVELTGAEQVIEKLGVSDVSLAANEVGMGICIGDEINIGDTVAFREKPAFKNAAEEAGTTCDQEPQN
jgi:hypothetical protein